MTMLWVSYCLISLLNPTTSIQIQKCHPYTDSRNLGMVKTHFYIVKMVYIHTNAAYTNAA